ncbi:MAG TPA: hypothetical protein VML55_08885 [Planctomycetaceae bacterium]|nr:hypothetical protein [Planctomycetaceae bacterium]
MTETGVVVPPQDPQLIYRIVGFLEYGMAIHHLDEFVRRASSEELEIADAIVRHRPQFDVRTNLSRHIGGPSLLNEPVAGTGDSTRRGLAWVLALARVELGAMLAGFSSVAQPFQFVAPTPYETHAYREILTDGLRVHYWSFKRDPAVANYPRTGVPEQHIITYGRRVGVARRFLEAARDFSRRLVSPGQQAELNSWERDFRRFELVLLYCLAQKISVHGERFEVSEELWNCPSLCQAAAREVGHDLTNRRDERSLGTFSARLSDLLASIDPTLLAVPCQHTPVQQPPIGGPRRRR